MSKSIGVIGQYLDKTRKQDLSSILIFSYCDIRNESTKLRVCIGILKRKKFGKRKSRRLEKALLLKYSIVLFLPRRLTEFGSQ